MLSSPKSKQAQLTCVLAVTHQVVSLVTVARQRRAIVVVARSIREQVALVRMRVVAPRVHVDEAQRRMETTKLYEPVQALSEPQR